MKQREEIKPCLRSDDLKLEIVAFTCFDNEAKEKLEDKIERGNKL